MSRCALFFLIFALAAWPVRADELFRQPAEPATLLKLLGPVASELRSAQTLRGQYVQSKQLAELKKPLTATGDFLFVRGKGIVWRTLTPFASTLTLTPEAMIQQEGSRRIVMGAAQQPAVRIVAQTFFAVLSLDLDSLAEIFALHGDTPAAGRWRLGLKPRQAGMGLSEVEVQGGTQVERIILRETGGDLTTITLSGTASSASATAADLAAFAP